MSLVRDLRSPTRASLGNEDTCVSAAEGAHLEILKWVRDKVSNLGFAEAIENECPYHLGELKVHSFSPEITAYLETLSG